MPAQKVPQEDLASTVQAWNEGLHVFGIKGAATKLGLQRMALDRRLRKARADGMTVHPPGKPGGKGRSLEDFRREHDKNFIVPQKVKAAIASLGDGWLYEMEFAKLAGVSLADLGNFRAMFEANFLSVRRDGGKRVWASAKIITKMREMVS